MPNIGLEKIALDYVVCTMWSIKAETDGGATAVLII